MESTTPIKHIIPNYNNSVVTTPSISFGDTSLYESTPVTSSNSPNSQSKRKRKQLKRATAVYSPPQFSSTLNESSSIADDFDEQCHINQRTIAANATPTPKKQKLVDAATTNNNTISLSSSCQQQRFGGGGYRQFYEASPAKEAREILYENLRPVLSKRTPQKTNNTLFPDSTEEESENENTKKLFDEMVDNDVIMSNLYTYLSDNDLLRLSRTAKVFRSVIARNSAAAKRLDGSLINYSVNKENYKITPPNSPPHNNSSDYGGVVSKCFNDYIKTAKTLTDNQSLVKCPRCEKPSVVENSLGQCLSITCGYIHCLLCLSFSTNGPENFHDKCKNSSILLPNNNNNNSRMNRSHLGDISNSMSGDSGFFGSSIDSSYVATSFQSSASASIGHVKRNLSFQILGERSLFSTNNNQDRRRAKQRRQSLKSGERNSATKMPLPVVRMKQCTAVEPLSPPDSPPRVTKSYGIGSKQSKRNVKRSTM